MTLRLSAFLCLNAGTQVALGQIFRQALGVYNKVGAEAGIGVYQDRYQGIDIWMNASVDRYSGRY